MLMTEYELISIVIMLVGMAISLVGLMIKLFAFLDNRYKRK